MNGTRNRVLPLRLIAAALLLAAVAATGVADAILINRPTLSLPSAETEAFLDAQILRSLAEAEANYEGLRLGYNGFQQNVNVSRPTVTVDVIAADIEGATMLVMNATSSDGRSESLVYRMPWHDAFYREIAQMLGFFDSVLGSTRSPATGEIVFLQEFLTDFIASGDMQFGIPPYPYSLSSREGNLLFAGGSVIVETDRYFREQQKIGLSAELPGSWAMHVGVTPAGTVAAASLSQGGLVRFVPDIPQPFRVPTRTAVTNLAVGTDGTLFTLDQNQQFLRVADDGIGPMNLGLPDGSYISFMRSGPDNTLWIWEPTQRSILIYDSEGNRLDMIIPHVPFDVGLTMKHFQAYENGDVFLVFGDRFIRAASTGAIVWEYRFSDLDEVNDFTLINNFHLDEETGTIYALRITDKYIFQFLDLALARDRGSIGPTEQRILASNERLRGNPFDQQAIAERARIYEEIGAWELAAMNWENAYGLNPLDNSIASSRDQVLLRRLEENADRLYDQAIRLLEQFGVSSAAYAYQKAQETYEQVISRSTSPGQAEERLRELRRRFEETQNPQLERPPLNIDNVALADVFPSLFTLYQTQRAGTVTVRNAGTGSISNLRVQAEMRFLDFATQGGSVRSLGPGEEAELDVRLPISARALALQESTPVPVNLTLSYEAGGSSYESSQVEIITVHRATALTWDDSGKLAAYVTPRDSIVEAFAAPFVNVGEAERFAVSEKIFRAARISDAVGAGGLEYIEDPQSGITQVLGNPTLLDTVRFPRNTIRVGFGDCDDTTALMCSLFESVGIRTAIMTSPGHVFMAFDTGEPSQNKWLFESGTTAAIAHNGTVWLPYETTILNQGFLASWEEGSRLYNRYEPQGQIEFLPLEEIRSRFPALPLETASFSVTPPPQLLVEPVYGASLEGIRETLYLRSVRELEQTVGAQSARRQVRTWNQIGILHGQFDEPRDAERAFETAISIDPDYPASYINLANLSILAGDGRAALRWLDEAEGRRSGTVIATLLRAQAEFITGNRSGAAEQMAIVQRRAPELAAQYPHLSGSAAGRASEAQAQPVLPWSLGEDE